MKRNQSPWWRSIKIFSRVKILNGSRNYMSGYTSFLLISVLLLGYYLSKGTQCKEELGTLWRLCHSLPAVCTKVNSIRLLLCTRQKRFTPKFLISLANCHYKTCCQFCKHLRTVFNWAVHISRKVYLLKYWPDQILCHSWNFTRPQVLNL